MNSQALVGKFVTLEPLSIAHTARLLEAALEDRSSYDFVALPANEEEAEIYVRAAVEESAAGRQMPFAIVCNRERRILGATRFARLTHWQWPRGVRAEGSDGPDAVEIGYTWLAGSAQRTVVNSESKLLMLRHAFETWGVCRVRFRTDVRNLRSRRALERLGAKFDGVLRADWPGADGSVRDSAFYSLLAGEWPAVSARLRERIDHPSYSDA